MITFFCKIHKTTNMFALSYYTNIENPSKKRNNINFLYCPSCDKVYKLRFTLKQARESIFNFRHLIIKENRERIKKFKQKLIEIKKKEKQKLKRKIGRPFSPKPLPIKITRVRDGWYWSAIGNKFHFIKNNKYYCHPNFKVNLNLIPVKNTKKMNKKMCIQCARKKGIFRYEVFEE